MMKPMRVARQAIGKWLQRAILALAEPPAHSDRKASTEYYRFPMF